MATLKIGICGEGIGGFCEILALRQQGHEVTVFERAKQSQRIGADVNFKCVENADWVYGYDAWCVELT